MLSHLLRLPSQRISSRRLWRRALLWLPLVLGLLAGPWGQPAFAGSTEDPRAMAICSVGNAGNSAPLHSGGGHCQLCCSGQPSGMLPVTAMLHAPIDGFVYPLSRRHGGNRLAGPTPGSPQARAPPSA